MTCTASAAALIASKQGWHIYMTASHWFNCQDYVVRKKGILKEIDRKPLFLVQRLKTALKGNKGESLTYSFPKQHRPQKRSVSLSYCVPFRPLFLLGPMPFEKSVYIYNLGVCSNLPTVFLLTTIKWNVYMAIPLRASKKMSCNIQQT